MCSERYGGVFALAIFETLKGYEKTRCLQTDRVYSIWTIEFILTHHTVDGKNPETTSDARNVVFIPVSRP